MEKIQERASRFIYEDFNSDYDTLLLKSGLSSLKIRRLRMMAIEIFKILHKQSPAYLNDIVSFKHISYSFRRQQTVEIPQVRTTNHGFGLYSLRYAGATLWNELPDAIRAQTNLNQFKSDQQLEWQLMQMWLLQILIFSCFILCLVLSDFFSF